MKLLEVLRFDLNLSLIFVSLDPSRYDNYAKIIVSLRSGCDMHDTGNSIKSVSLKSVVQILFTFFRKSLVLLFTPIQACVSVCKKVTLPSWYSVSQLSIVYKDLYRLSFFTNYFSFVNYKGYEQRESG